MKVKVEKLYLKLVDYSYYRDTYSWREKKEPYRMYKPCLKMVLPILTFPKYDTRSEFSRTIELTAWDLLPHDMLDDIKKLWGSQLICYLRSNNSTLKSMAEAKNEIVGNTEVPVVVAAPSARFCKTSDEWDKLRRETHGHRLNYLRKAYVPNNDLTRRDRIRKAAIRKNFAL